MRGTGVLLAAVVLYSLSAANARPDCNACFMKNAGRDKESNSTVSEGQQQYQGSRVERKGEALERVLRSKRTAAAAWGAPGSVASAGAAQGGESLKSLKSLRDVLLAQNVERMRERVEADADQQWWENSPSDVDGTPEDRLEGGDWGDIQQQAIPSYSQQLAALSVWPPS